MSVALEPILYIIDDDICMLESLNWLTRSNGIETKTYNNANSFLEDFLPGSPGCVLSDMLMPGINGIELQNRLRILDAPLPVILITGFASVTIAVQAMKNGVFDFIEKPIDDTALLATIKEAFAANQKYHKARRYAQQQQTSLKNLTKRERDVYDLIVQGHANKIISEKLRIAQKTVETHRANVMKKTNARSLSDLIALRD